MQHTKGACTRHAIPHQCFRNRCEPRTKLRWTPSSCCCPRHGGVCGDHCGRHGSTSMSSATRRVANQLRASALSHVFVTAMHVVGVCLLSRARRSLLGSRRMGIDCGCLASILLGTGSPVSLHCQVRNGLAHAARSSRRHSCWYVGRKHLHLLDAVARVQCTLSLCTVPPMAAPLAIAEGNLFTGSRCRRQRNACRRQALSNTPRCTRYERLCLLLLCTHTVFQFKCRH